MNRKREKVKNKIFLSMICAIGASLFCSSALADNSSFFYPIPDESAETLAASNIYLDSSKVDHPILRGVFPSPSEYKAKSTLPADVFEPTDSSKTVLQRTYKVDDKENPTEIKAVETVEDENKGKMSFEDLNFIPSPSEYKKPAPITIATPPKELPSLEEEKEGEEETSYYASAEESGGENADLEGKTITSISFSGLNLINENSLLNVINSRNGSVFNSSRLQQDLQNIYALGYFTDNMHIEPTLNDNDTITLEFTVEENPEVKEVQISGNTIYSANELLVFTRNIKGMPQNLNEINSSIEKINKYYEDNGYILAKVTNVDDTEDGILTLGITEGIIDKIVFEGERKTKDYVIQRNIMTQPGTVYNEEMLKKDLAKIYATQIFEEVNRKIEPSPDYEGEYIVTINVKEASSDSISIGGGVDNALGVFGSLSILEKNFLGKGQQLGLSGMIGSGLLLSDASIKNRMNYQVELNFTEPYFINADNSLTSKLYLRELGSYQVPLAVERRFGLNGVIKHKVQGKDNLSTTLGVGFENIYLKEGDYEKIANQYAIRHVDFAKREQQLVGGSFINIAPGVQYSTLDNEFMPRNGIIAKANFTEALALDNLKNTNGRLAGTLTRYIPVFEKSTLAVSAKGGIKVHGDDMPEVMAFRLGGPYTIRGFRMNGVGSGNSFLMGSVELQTPLPFMDKFKYEVLKNLRFAFFVDAGKIWEPTITSTLYDRPNSAITAGVGLRINIPGLGPISVDYGLPITNVGDYNKQHGYFTFGTGGLYDSY